MIDCIIFDCDGTLVDSEYLCNLALEVKLKEYGIEEDANKMASRFHGAKLSLVIDQLESEHEIKFDDSFVSSYRDIVSVLFKDQLIPCDGVKEMLESIQYPICVASSGPLEKIRTSLSLTGLRTYFNENLFSSYEIGSWKPAPDIFVHAAKEMGFCLSCCAVVEDSYVGISAAISAGVIPIHYNPNNIQKSISGAYQVSHMSELKGLLESLR